jgi:adenosine deaminase
LHVHLESTLRPSTLAALGGAAPPAVFAGFGAFADYNAAVRACLRSPTDFERVAYEFCLDSAADGVRYAEVTVTAAAHGARLGIGPAAVLDGVLSGLRAGSDEAGIETRVLIDHSRRRPLPWAEESVRLAADHPAAVVGFGVAGDETAPISPYRAVVDRAAAAGVHLVHHAGETAGADSVRDALDVGRAERIGHGIRSLEDPELVARLRDERVPLEVCPSSNVVLGLVPSLAAHPLPALVEAGLVVTLNTDIPAITGRTLSAEYAAVRDTIGCTDEDLARLAGAAVHASFAPPAARSRLHHDIATWLSAD